MLRFFPGNQKRKEVIETLTQTLLDPVGSKKAGQMDQYLLPKKFSATADFR